MKGFTVKCPICGTLNKSLFLEETEGKYECEWCVHTGLINGYRHITERSIRMHIQKENNIEHKKRLNPLLV